MKRRSFLAGLLALPAVVLGTKALAGDGLYPHQRDAMKALKFGERYGTETPWKESYVFVVAETAYEARQYISNANSDPEAKHIGHLIVSLNEDKPHLKFMGHKNCQVVVVGRVGRSEFTLAQLRKVKEETQRRSTTWYYPPKNAVITNLA